MFQPQAFETFQVMMKERSAFDKNSETEIREKSPMIRFHRKGTQVATHPS
jgi:hypothetical protein